MKNGSLLILLLATLFSCGQSKKSVTESNEVKIETGCYYYESNGSVAGFKINQVDDTVQGELVYSILEKDQNFGTFVGKIEGDKLIGDYSFTSEGLESKRQVAFQVTEGKITEGFGEIIVDENEVRLKDLSKLSFTNGLTFDLTDCDALESECFFEKNAIKSQLTNNCINPSELEFELNQIEEGEIDNSVQAYLHFDNGAENAEIFLPNSKTGILLKKTGEGNWSDGDYLLFAWKGFVLQKDGENIFVGGN
ncbi:hypothetical protein MM236_18000 [Belliella sp. DSM 107340]|uniref:Lipoprotein n=1 Tax=Belliella calami TaxID=2923436 RepID=A0ABS9UUG5_9BACT|nr:hypothetical protein [Belliella calami]MCH7399893.1 hypothetical protein [Belliella calami]